MCHFEVRADAPGHPVLRGVERFEIYDECYVVETCAAVEPLLYTNTAEVLEGTGADRLLLGWTRQYGAGKVVYLAPGHGAQQLRHPALGTLVANTLRWFAQ
jgi:type 1 glutamine amidotransferase